MTTPVVHSHSVSQTGPVREENQDSIRVHVPEDPAVAASHGSLFVIADGMGGYAHGAEASATALDTIFTAFYDQRHNSPQQSRRNAVNRANLAVNQAAFRLNAGQMGTTLTAANVVGNRLHLAHVGDTRAYLVRGGQATCLTNDHTVVGELVRMKVLSPDKVRTHHQRSVLNKCLGLNLFVNPDITHTVLQSDDVVVLCSDGVWAYVEDRDIARLAAQYAEGAELGQRLVDLAIQHQTDDNVSVIVFRVEQLPVTEAIPLTAPRWQQVLSFLGQLL